MALFFDDRARLKADGTPGLHALVVGVSTYTHIPGGGGAPAEESLGLQQLAGTARTAHKVAEWLVTANTKKLLPHPLASIRLLLSPSTTKETDLAGIAPAATWENVAAAAKEWRTEASASNEGATFFYFAGHGVERRNADAVLLLADYGDPAAGAMLNNAVDAAHLLAGMAPLPDAAQQIARTQFYFFDACRTLASEFAQYEWEEVRKIWSIKIGGVDNRTTAAFFGAAPGDSAYTQDDQTLFSRALIDCLERRAAIGPEPQEPRWRVTTTSLIDALPSAIAAVNAEKGTTQDFAPGGTPRKATLAYLAAPPEVEVVMSVHPETKVGSFGFEVRNRQDVSLKRIVPIDPHPHPVRLPAGFYRLIAFPQPPEPAIEPVSEIVPVTVPECPPWIARVERT